MWPKIPNLVKIDLQNVKFKYKNWVLVAHSQRENNKINIVNKKSELSV